MADSIPRARRKAWADTIAAKTLYAALFVNLTGYDELTATTYALLVVGGATEVSASGTGYTTGGVALSGVASSNLATNGAKVTASATTISSATFTFRYVCIYDHTTGTIEGIKDLLADKTVTGGTVTITWDSTNGVIKIN